MAKQKGNFSRYSKQKVSYIEARIGDWDRETGEVLYGTSFTTSEIWDEIDNELGGNRLGSAERQAMEYLEDEGVIDRNRHDRWDVESVNVHDLRKYREKPFGIEPESITPDDQKFLQ